MATAASFASRIVCARIGSGASTNTSRCPGNMESQLNTAKTPTTSIVVAMRKCSMLHANITRICAPVALVESRL